MHFQVRLVACAALAAALAACATHQTGPERPITKADDVALARALLDRDLSEFSGNDSATQAKLRNEILTARMYIADMEYHYYEARLTRELQDEGMLATAASLGLTTSATLLSPAGTKTILSGIATGVTGMDKAYNEKVLLSNSIQALQTQMRVDRKTQAGAIYAKMFRNLTATTRIITPIEDYTLPMALSDADGYYQAGTISSALIGLSKTVANADQTADQIKAAAGPNPVAVTTVRAASAPIAPPPQVARSAGPTVVVTAAPRVITAAPRDASYTRLRSLMLPGGERNAPIADYVEKLLGAPPAQAGLVLNDQKTFGPLYNRISNCIVARNVGRPCPDGSLQKFR